MLLPQPLSHISSLLLPAELPLLPAAVDKSTPEQPARSLLAFPQPWPGQEFPPSVALLDYPCIYERETQLQRDVSFFPEPMDMKALINHQ